MQIDWITVAAQIANFLVLVWLLNRLLYGPVTRAMTEREEGIARRLSEADEKRAEAEAEAERLREKQHELDARREELLLKARDDVRQKREAMEQELQEHLDALRRARAEQVAEEEERLLREIRQCAGRHVQEVARKVLGEFAGADLGDGLANRFIEKLRGLDDAARERLRKAAEERSPNAVVESSVPLSSPVRGHLTRALHEMISDRIEADYRENAEIELGLRLTIAEQVVEWSARAWFDHLEGALSDALETIGGTRKEGAA